MPRVFIHPLAGVLSAYGMGLADITALRERTVEQKLEEGNIQALESLLDELAADAKQEILKQGISEGNVSIKRKVLVRYVGTDTPSSVDFERDSHRVRQAFEAIYRDRFGFVLGDKDVIVETAIAEAVGHTGSAAKEIPGMDSLHAES